MTPTLCKPALPLLRPAALAEIALLGTATDHAQTGAFSAQPVETVSLAQAPNEVTATSRVDVFGHNDNATGSSDAAPQCSIRAVLIKARPALRPGELLEFVPGMSVTPHSGDARANQYFLRGFNLDHGTDFATSLNGMPDSRPNHAHGQAQGFTDLTVLIPGLVQRVDHRTGPYFARRSDFASAGAADISLCSNLDAPFAQLTLDQNGLRRGNGVLSASAGTTAQGWTASVMGCDAHWTAADRVSPRLIDAGSCCGKPFGRFDSLDPSDGGTPSRYSLSGEWHRKTGDGNSNRVSAGALR